MGNNIEVKNQSHAVSLKSDKFYCKHPKNKTYNL